jgi:hypothetical protein
MAKVGQPAYFYRFSWVLEAQRRRLPGATRGWEIAYASISFVLKEKTSPPDLVMAGR